MPASANQAAFPRLDPHELELVARMATVQTLEDGQPAFTAGQSDIDFFIVLEGRLDIFLPGEPDRVIASHGPGEFSGDIDLLTRRPIVVTGRAGGPTKVLRVPGVQLRRLLNTVPLLSEKLIDAFTLRRELLAALGGAGLHVFGSGHCPDTNLLREFLHKNFVPYVWLDADDAASANHDAELAKLKHPAVRCQGGDLLERPTLKQLAQCAGLWRECPTDVVDLLVVGSGPAGIAAAVYAASEGLSTIVLDRMGPGGQVAGSSRVENFIGFPSGLSGTELATRGVLQMLKFGARLITPVNVERLEVSKASGDPHTVHLDCGAKIQAAAVLVATGAKWRRLDAANARRFEGAGIYYSCTTVEAFGHDSQDVVVVGPGNAAGQAAMFLAECCPGRTVHMLIRGRQLGPGMSEYLAKRIFSTPNIKVVKNVEVSRVLGQTAVEGVVINACNRDEHADKDAPSTLGAEVGVIACTGIFVFIGAEPHSRWLPPEIAKDDKGYVLTGDRAFRSGKWAESFPPCELETSVCGVLAAGDVRAGSTKRVGFAVGDGSLAITCVHALRTRLHHE